MRWLLLPINVVIELLVFAFDMIASRYIVAGAIIGIFWTPLYLVFGLSDKCFFWPTLALGMCLCGLWDGCEIFTIRDSLARYGIVRSWFDVKWKT